MWEKIFQNITPTKVNTFINKKQRKVDFLSLKSIKSSVIFLILFSIDMKQQTKSWILGWKGNILAIVIALILTAVVYLAFQNNTALFADIAGWKKTPVFSEQGDIGVFLKNAHTLELQSIKDIPHVQSISILLIFDPENISFDTKSFQSKFPFTYASAWEGNGQLILTIQNKLKAWENIVNIWWNNQDMTKVVVGDTLVHFDDGSTEFLSIENFNL